MMRLSIYCLNGPNLNLLGVREPHIYGAVTLADIETLCAEVAAESGADLTFRQTNHEGVLVDWIHEARTEAHALVLNAGALTHTSIALHDALKCLTIPVIETHLSNPHAREPFRHTSFVAPAATGIVAGLGSFGYRLAILAAAHLAEQKKVKEDG